MQKELDTFLEGRSYEWLDMFETWWDDFQNQKIKRLLIKGM